MSRKRPPPGWPPLPPVTEQAERTAPRARAQGWLEAMGIPRRPISAAAFVRLLSADAALKQAFDQLPRDRDLSHVRLVDADELTAADVSSGQALDDVLWSSRQRSLIGYLRDADRAFVHDWLGWWAARPTPSTVADVGTGAGLLACGYAALASATRVVALDPHPAAAEVTAQWAVHARVARRVTTATGPFDSVVRLGTFDRVTMTRVLARLGGVVTRGVAADALDWASELRAGWARPVPPRLAALVGGAARAVADGGELVVGEQVTGTGVIGVYLGALQDAGLGADLDASGATSYGDDLFVRLVVRRGTGPVTCDEVVQWYERLPRGSRHRYAVADTDRRAWGAPLWWARIRCPEATGGALHRVEVLRRGEQVAVWQSTSRRYRRLELATGDADVEVRRWRLFAARQRAVNGCAVETSDGSATGVRTPG